MTQCLQLPWVVLFPTFGLKLPSTFGRRIWILAGVLRLWRGMWQGRRHMVLIKGRNREVHNRIHQREVVSFCQHTQERKTSSTSTLSVGDMFEKGRKSTHRKVYKQETTERFLVEHAGVVLSAHTRRNESIQLAPSRWLIYYINHRESAASS